MRYVNNEYLAGASEWIKTQVDAFFSKRACTRIAALPASPPHGRPGTKVLVLGVEVLLSEAPKKPRRGAMRLLDISGPDAWTEFATVYAKTPKPMPPSPRGELASSVPRPRSARRSFGVPQEKCLLIRRK